MSAEKIETNKKKDDYWDLAEKLSEIIENEWPDWKKEYHEFKKRAMKEKLFPVLDKNGNVL